MVVLTETPPATPALGVSSDTAEWIAMALRRFLIQPFVDHERALLNDTELHVKLGGGCDKILYTIGYWPMGWLTDELESVRDRITEHAQGRVSLADLAGEIRVVVGAATARLVRDDGTAL